jgi:hypothetical protein
MSLFIKLPNMARKREAGNPDVSLHTAKPETEAQQQLPHYFIYFNKSF